MTTRAAAAQFLLVVSVSIFATAQTASLSGTIKDDSGAPVANAQVSLKSTATGQVANTQADAQGKYRFDEVAPGAYEISAVADGFSAKTANVPLAQGANSSQNLDLTLSRGPSLADLGFNTAQTEGNPEEQARLDKRTHMLKIHQRMGLITAGPLLASIIAGTQAGGKSTSSASRDFHVALGSATADLYFITAYYAIRAPRIKGTETRGPIRVHKTLAWIHGPGMILTSILGPIAFDQKSKGEKVHGIASLHGPVAIVTGAAFGAALLSVSVKF